MLLKKWDRLPDFLKKEEVKKYYFKLYSKRYQLIFKRIFDVLISIILGIILLPLLLVIAILIKTTSEGKVIFRQKRITQYGREFNIYKFRTMVNNAQSLGAAVTTDGDSRVTRVGRILRKYRLDEIPQLLNIIVGDMTFVGTRPEVPKYVSRYSNEMMATLLLPAGVTSNASICYKDEEKLLQNQEDVDEIYATKVLPEKMHYNLEYLQKFGFCKELKILLKTVVAVIK